MASAASQAAPSTSAAWELIDSRAPEFRLLLACCSQKSTVQSEARVRDLWSREIDWSRFLELIDKHGVLPLAQPSLTRARDLIPDNVWSELQKRFAEHIRRCLYLTGLLHRIYQALGDARVPVLAYKGPVLAQRLYGDIALRQYSDLDFFVRVEDVTRAKAALRELGLIPHLQFRSAEESALLQSGYEMTFDGLGNKNLVELQWRVLPAFYCVEFDTVEFFSRAQSVTLAGSVVQTLSDEDLVLALCSHAAKHGWTKLAWICDIARLSGTSGIDWAQIQLRAKEMGISRIVGISFFLAKELVGSAVPVEIEPLTNDESVSAIGHRIAQQMALEFELDAESVEYFWLMLRSRERLPDRTRFLMRLITTPSISEWSLIKLPRGLFPFYRIIRIFRLIARLLRFGRVHKADSLHPATR